MKKLILVAILSTSLSTFLQSQSIISSSKIALGKNLTTGKDITATKFDFEKEIIDFTLDTTFNTLTIQFRDLTKAGLQAKETNKAAVLNGKFYEDKGEIAVFDLKSAKILWSRKIDYTLESLTQKDGILLLNQKSESTKRLDLLTGTELWKADFLIMTSFTKSNIGLGYEYGHFTKKLESIDLTSINSLIKRSADKSFKKQLEGIDLSTGKSVWKRDVNKNFGWNDFVNLNDTAIIVKSSGLHQFNIKTGQGWDYDAQTEIPNYSKKIQANSASVGYNFLNDLYDTAEGNDLLSNLSSNLATDSLGYFFASKKILVKISKAGHVIWKAWLPNETSQSRIIFDNTNLYVINNGEAIYNGNQITYGKPYIAAFNKLTGKKKYLQNININNSLSEICLNNDSLTLVFKDRICIASLKNGKILKMSKYDADKLGAFEYAIDQQKVYIQSDSTLQNLDNNSSKANYLMSSTDELIQLNKYMEFEKTISRNNLYSLINQTTNFNLYYNNNKVVITNKQKQNQKIGTLGIIGEQVLISCNKLYEISGKSLYEVDLDAELK